MTSMEFLELLGSVQDKFVEEARAMPAVPRRRISFRRASLIAAVIALAALLVGCTVAYAQGWFAEFFADRSDTPLSDSQIEYIQENEQIIMETQAKGGWTVALKSAISDGETGFLLFGITAPEDIDLEGYHAGNYGDDYITPGNNSWNRHPSRAMVVASTGFLDEEKNFIWQSGGGGGWKADNDGLSHTMNYVIAISCEKLYPDREMLLENPFGPEVAFTVCFDGFTREYKDPEIQKAIDEKYAGMTDYMVADEDLVGLHKSEVLTEEQWEFSVAFHVLEKESVELITGEPVMTWGQVTWKLDDHPIAYETGTGLAAVKITSFVLNPFGATVTYDLKEPALCAFIEYQNSFGYEDRSIFAVMKDGSRIALHTHGTGDQLEAETPIVLSELDHILLGSGEQLPMP